MSAFANYCIPIKEGAAAASTADNEGQTEEL